jgi:SUMO ligase MMS21 Smc5/6 complex component
MERTITLFEDGEAIFALRRHIDTRNNNPEEQIADFVIQMGTGKGLIEPMRVANRIRIICNRHSIIDVMDILRHPDEWKINEVRPLPEDELDKIKIQQEKVKQALDTAGMN